jgi:hypothetical protein
MMKKVQKPNNSKPVKALWLLHVPFNSM